MRRELVELKTIPQMVRKCKEVDPDTDINDSMLYALVREGKLSYVKHGTRIILSYAEFRFDVLDLLQLEHTVSFPKIRTIEKCAQELRRYGRGFCDKTIRKLIREGLLPTLQIGNRHYVAIQSFDNYHYTRFISRFQQMNSQCYQADNDAMNQIKNIYEREGCKKRIEKQMVRLKV